MPEPETPSDDPSQLADQLLSAAFGEESNPFQTGSATSMAWALRDVEKDEEPIARSGGDESIDRHQALDRLEVIGEISRGGMGVVYKARDTYLGRDVALKTLRRRHAADPERRQRFTEEAQICSQLQHPGIVAVHDVGNLGDGRPYFLMKLLTGRTLSSRLKARKDPTDEQLRYVSIVEQLCQAVAYAHARGVIHRDLKPSNVMVGSYGEMQVMDWGLAKVVNSGGLTDDAYEAPAQTRGDDPVETVRTGSSALESVSGSVFGTAPYMAPEQARGDVDTLDERADVFSLGAILLEVLTGTPPYVAESGPDALIQAAAAELDDAHSRLDECSADTALIDLARTCIAVLPADRPADAGVVATRLAAYLDAVKQRAHDAELAAVAADSRASAEVRRRRLAIVLAVTVIAAGAGFIVTESARRDRELRVTRAVTSTMDRARHASVAAGNASEGDLSEWTYAVATAKDAVALANDVDVPSDLGAEAKELLDELRTLQRAHLQDRATIERLEKIRTGYENRHALPATEARYMATFIDYGIDIRSLASSAIAEKIVASSSRVQEATSLPCNRRRVSAQSSSPLASWREIGLAT